MSPLFKSNKTKQTENNFRYWRDCGFGRVDHCQDFLVIVVAVLVAVVEVEADYVLVVVSVVVHAIGVL